MRIRSMLATAVLVAVPLPADAVGVPATTADPAFHATVATVPEEYRDLMIGVSWKPGCPVPIDDLRIIEMNHWGFDGTVHDGGLLMVHREVADDVIAAFGEIFASGSRSAGWS